MTRKVDMMDRPRPSAEQAFADYLALGAGRSLTQLIDHYAERGVDAPSLRTLKAWSTQYGWQNRVAEHEEQVSGLVQAMAIEGTARGHLDLARDIRSASQALVAEILAAIERAQVADVNGVATLADIFVMLSSHALEIERGRPPSAEILENVLRNIGPGAGGTVGDFPEPEADRADILSRFEALTKGAGDKPN